MGGEERRGDGSPPLLAPAEGSGEREGKKGDEAEDTDVARSRKRIKRWEDEDEEEEEHWVGLGGGGEEEQEGEDEGELGEGSWGGREPEETNMDPGRASPTEREAELAEGMETEQAEEPGPAMLPPRRPAPLAPPRPLPRHGDPGGAGGAAGLRRDGPYQFINRYSEQTLRELQYIKLMLDLNIGPTQAEKILAYFKALHPSTLQRMPATYAALTRRYAAPTGMVRLQVKDVPVPQDARDYLGVRCPETLAFP